MYMRPECHDVCPRLVVAPLLWLGYPPLGMRLDSRTRLWLTLAGVDNAGINFILAREKKLYKDFLKKKKNESCLSAKPGHELREILLKSRNFKFSEFNLKPSRRPGRERG